MDYFELMRLRFELWTTLDPVDYRYNARDGGFNVRFC